MLDEKNKRPLTPVGGNENIDERKAKDAPFASQRGNNRRSASPDAGRANYADYTKRADTSTGKIGENGENKGEKVAVPYVKKADRIKAAQSGAATAGYQAPANARSSDRTADSPIPPASADRLQSDRPMGSPFGYPDPSRRDNVAPDRPYDRPYPTRDGRPMTETERREFDDQQRQRMEEDDFQRERENMRYNAGKTAWQTQNPAYAENYLRERSGGATAPFGYPYPQGKKPILRQTQSDYRALNVAEEHDALAIANDEIQRELEIRQAEQEKRAAKHLKKREEDDDFFLVDQPDSGLTEEEAITQTLTDREERVFEREKARIDRRADVQKRRFVMRTSTFDGAGDAESKKMKSSEHDKFFDDAVLEDYLAKRFAAMRTDNAPYMRPLSRKEQRLEAKKEKAARIDEAADIEFSDGMSIASSENDEKNGKNDYDDFGNQSIGKADTYSADRREKRDYSENYLREYESELSVSLQAQREEETSSQEAESDLLKLLVAVENGRKTAENNIHALNERINEAEKKARQAYALSVQSQKNAKTKKAELEKTKLQSKIPESYLKKIEKEALREEQKAKLDLKNAYRAEAIVKMERELLEQTLTENQNGLFALISAEENKSAQTEKEEAKRRAEISSDAARRARSKAEQAKTDLTRIQMNLMIPLPRSERAELQKKESVAKETKNRTEREAAEKSERAEISEYVYRAALAKVKTAEAKRLEREALLKVGQLEAVAKTLEIQAEDSDDYDYQTLKKQAEDARIAADAAYYAALQKVKDAANAVKNEAEFSAVVFEKKRISAERAATNAKEEAENAATLASKLEARAEIATHGSKRDDEHRAKTARAQADQRASVSAAAQKFADAERQKENEANRVAATAESNYQNRAEASVQAEKERAQRLVTDRLSREKHLRKKEVLLTSEDHLEIADYVGRLRERRLAEIPAVDTSVLASKYDKSAATRVFAEKSEKASLSSAKMESLQNRKDAEAKKEAKKEADKDNIQRSESRKEASFEEKKESQIAKQNQKIQREELESERALREAGERDLSEIKEYLQSAVSEAEKKTEEAYRAEKNARLTASFAKKKEASALLPDASEATVNRAREMRVEADRLSRKAKRAYLEAAMAEAEVKSLFEKCDEQAFENDLRNTAFAIDRQIRGYQLEMANAQKQADSLNRVKEQAIKKAQAAKESQAIAENSLKNAKDNAERDLSKNAVRIAAKDYQAALDLVQEKTDELQKTVAKRNTLKAKMDFAVADRDRIEAQYQVGAAQKKAAYYALIAERLADADRIEAEETAKKYEKEAENVSAACLASVEKSVKAAVAVARCEEAEAALEAESALHVVASAEAAAKAEEELSDTAEQKAAKASKEQKAVLQKEAAEQREKAKRALSVLDVEREHANRAAADKARKRENTELAEKNQLSVCDADAAKIHARVDTEARRLSERQVRLLLLLGKLSESEKQQVYKKGQAVLALSVKDLKKQKQKESVAQSKGVRERKEVESTTGAADAEEYLDLYLRGKRLYPDINENLGDYISVNNNKVRKFEEKLAQTAEELERIDLDRKELKRFIDESAAKSEKKRQEHREAERAADEEIEKAKKNETVARLMAERAAKKQTEAFVRVEELKRALSNQTDKAKKHDLTKLLKDAATEAQNVLRFAEEQELILQRKEAETAAKELKAEKLRKDNAEAERQDENNVELAIAAKEIDIQERYVKAVRAEADFAEKKEMAAQEALQDALKKQRRAFESHEKDESANEQAIDAEKRHEDSRRYALAAKYEADLAEAIAREMSAKIQRISAEDAATEARLLAKSAEKEAQRISLGFGGEDEKAQKEAWAEVQKAEKNARQEEEKVQKALKAEADAANAVVTLQSKEADRLLKLAQQDLIKKRKKEEALSERAARAEADEKAERQREAREAKRESALAAKKAEEAEKLAAKVLEKQKKAAERAATIEKKRQLRAAEDALRDSEDIKKETQKTNEALSKKAIRDSERAKKEDKLKTDREELQKLIASAIQADAAETAVNPVTVKKADTVADYFYDYAEQDQKSKAAAKAKEWELRIAREEYEEAKEKALENRKLADSVTSALKKQSEDTLQLMMASSDAAESAKARSTRGRVNQALVKERKAAKAGEELEKAKSSARKTEFAAACAETIADIRKERLERLTEESDLRKNREEEGQKYRLALAEAKEAEALLGTIRKDADKAEEEAKILEEERAIAEKRSQSPVSGIDAEDLQRIYKRAQDTAKEAEKQAAVMRSVLEKAEISVLAKQAKAERFEAVIAAKDARLSAQTAKIAELTADLKAQTLTGDAKNEAVKTLKYLKSEADRAEKFALSEEQKAAKSMKAEAQAAERAARAERLEADRLARLATAEAEDVRNAANAAAARIADVDKEEVVSAERAAKFAAAEADRREASAKRAAETAKERAEKEKEAAKAVALVDGEIAGFFAEARKRSLEKAKNAAKKAVEREAKITGVSVKLTSDEREKFFEVISKEYSRIHAADQHNREQERRQSEHVEESVRNAENAKKIVDAKNVREEAYRRLMDARKDRQESERSVKKAKADAALAKKKAEEAADLVKTASEIEKEEAQNRAYFALREAKRMERILVEEEQKAQRASIAVTLAENELSAASLAADAAWETDDYEKAEADDSLTWTVADKMSLSELAKGKAFAGDKTDDAEQFLLSYSAGNFLAQEKRNEQGKMPKGKAEKTTVTAAMPSLTEKANTFAVLDAMAKGDITLSSDNTRVETHIAESYFDHVIADMLTEIDFLEICLSQQIAECKKQKGAEKMRTAAEIVDLRRAVCEKYFDVIAFGKEKNREKDVSRFVPKAVTEIQRYNVAVKKLEKMDGQKHTYASTKIPSAILSGSAYRPIISPEYSAEDTEKEKKRNVSAHAFRTDMSVIEARYNYRIATLNAKAKNERYTFTVDNLKHAVTKQKINEQKKELRKLRERALKAELIDNGRYENVLNGDPFTTSFKKRNVDRPRLEKLRTMLTSALAERDELNRRLLSLYAGEAPVLGVDDTFAVLENGKVKDGKTVRSFADAKYGEVLTKARKKEYRKQLSTAHTIDKLFIPDKTKSILLDLLNRKMELSAVIAATDAKIRIYGYRGTAAKQAIREANMAKREIRVKINPELRVRLRRAKEESRTRPGVRWFH